MYRLSKRRLHSSLGSRPIHSLKITASCTRPIPGVARLSHSTPQDTVYLDAEPGSLDDANLKDLDADTPKSDDTHFSDHLNGVFPPLQFPPELARRVLTHGSHKAAVEGHNSRFSFMGRRVLEAYLLLFLQSSSARQPSHDYDLITSRTLNSHVLGEHVAPHWGLGRVLRWVAPIPSTPLKKPAGIEKGKEILRSVGLYKVQGDAVQAVMGGIFHQFGGSIAHRVFHTRVLPEVLLPRRADGLLDVFHEDALVVCDRMGGPQGKLVLPHQDRKVPVMNKTALREQTIPRQNHNSRL